MGDPSIRRAVFWVAARTLASGCRSLFRSGVDPRLELLYGHLRLTGTRPTSWGAALRHFMVRSCELRDKISEHAKLGEQTTELASTDNWEGILRMAFCATSILHNRHCALSILGAIRLAVPRLCSVRFFSRLYSQANIRSRRLCEEVRAWLQS